MLELTRTDWTITRKMLKTGCIPPPPPLSEVVKKLAKFKGMTTRAMATSLADLLAVIMWVPFLSSLGVEVNMLHKTRTFPRMMPIASRMQIVVTRIVDTIKSNY